jgi:hypothetical protein
MLSYGESSRKQQGIPWRIPPDERRTGMNRRLAYCTNVHAGSDLESLRANLQEHGLAVKAGFAPQQPMGIGLWIAAPAAKKLLTPPQLAEFSEWLATSGLIPFTLNGFPYGNFHEPVVKHRVYHPTWYDPQRVDYTLDLIEILHAILPEAMEGSISTLPIAWGTPAAAHQQLLSAARHLGQVAQQLARLEETTGRLITLCLEPEPGCVLQRCEDVLSFFNNYLCSNGRAESRKRYIRVCHDVCHSAVMFEDQRDVLSRYAEHGIRVGKVQVSSAVEVDFDQLDQKPLHVLTSALASFAEDRYLHQTTVRPAPDAAATFFEDLPQALSAAQDNPQYLQGKWRVHFHVPIYLERFHVIGTTQQDILRCLEAVQLLPELNHFEVETYAWSVLPRELQRPRLADGIVQEMQWLADRLAGN